MSPAILLNIHLAEVFHKWRTRVLQAVALIVVFFACYIFIDQTKSEVLLINRTVNPVMIEEVFVGNKIANEKIEPYGFEYIHTKDSDILLNHMLEPSKQTRRRFVVHRWRLFRVSYISPEGRSVWYETGAVHHWGNRISVEFTESNGAVLKSGESLLRSWFERYGRSLPGSNWWD